MILNNFISWLFGCSSYNGTRARQTVTYYNVDGNPVTLNADNNFLYNLSYLPSSLNDNGNFCIAFGTNNAPNTPDYCLWQDGITTLTNSGYSYSTALKDGKAVIRITRTVINNTTEDITVSEIGLIVSEYNSAKILLAREVFDTPITVKANGGAQVFGIDIG